MTKISGQCLCGAVTYQGQSSGTEIGICHCGQCRRAHGGPFMGVEIEGFEASGPLTWFKSSDWGQRGFCPRCGTPLVWAMQDGSMANVSAGSLDDDRHLTGVKQHIFADNAPCFYDFADDAPRLSEAQTVEAFQAMLSAS